MKPALIFIFLILVFIIGILVVKYVFSAFPGLQKASSGDDGGIFKSIDQGETWVQLAIKREKDGEKIKISGLTIYDIEINPQDSQIIFAGTRNSGFIKSFDAGLSWRKLTRDSLGSDGDVLSVSVNPMNPQNIYLASYFGDRGRILKSEDMGETFKEVFVTHADKVKIVQVEVDNYDAAIVFASTSDGLFLESKDFGESWQVLKDFKQYLYRFGINPKDTRKIYVSFSKGGLFKTPDKGLNWQDLEGNLEKLYSRSELGPIQEISFDYSSQNPVYIGAGSRLLKSYNEGEKFEEINSFVVGQKYQISTISADFSGSNIIYVGGGGQIYKSVDGGKQWIVKKLKTEKNIKVLKIDPNNSSVIYAGVGK